MPQFQQNTKASVRRSIATLTHRDSFLWDTVLASPAPTASSFALQRAKRYPDEHFIGRVVYVISGTGAGQVTYVSNSALGTGVITVSPSLTPTLDATSIVELYPEGLDPESIDSSINDAIDSLAAGALDVYVETLSPVLDTARQVLTIPDTYIKFCDIRYQDSGGIWRVFRHSFTPESPGQEQGRDFIVEGRLAYLSEPIPDSVLIYKCSGYRLPAHPSSDSSLLEVPTPFVSFQAAAMLEQSLIGGSEIDPEAHSTRAGGWLQLAQLHRPAGNYTNYLPNTFVLDV